MKYKLKMEDKPVYTISIAAKLIGISVHTLRMYEREGFIIPYKTETNRRLYSDDDLDRINKLRIDINEGKLSISSILMMYSFIPCWLQKDCSNSERSKCNAFNEYYKPCWTYKHKKNLCAQLNCRECEVYKFNTNTGKIRETIVTAFRDRAEMQGTIN